MGGCCGAMKTGHKSLPEKSHAKKSGEINQEKSNGKEPLIQSSAVEVTKKEPSVENLPEETVEKEEEQKLLVPVQLSFTAAEPQDEEKELIVSEEPIAAQKKTDQLESVPVPVNELTLQDEFDGFTEPEVIQAYQVPVQHSTASDELEEKLIKLQVDETELHASFPTDVQLSISENFPPLKIEETYPNEAVSINQSTVIPPPKTNLTADVEVEAIPLPTPVVNLELKTRNESEVQDAAAVVAENLLFEACFRKEEHRYLPQAETLNLTELEIKCEAESPSTALAEDHFQQHDQPLVAITDEVEGGFKGIIHAEHRPAEQVLADPVHALIQELPPPVPEPAEVDENIESFPLPPEEESFVVVESEAGPSSTDFHQEQASFVEVSHIHVDEAKLPLQPTTSKAVTEQSDSVPMVDDNASVSLQALATEIQTAPNVSEVTFDESFVEQIANEEAPVQQNLLETAVTVVEEPVEQDFPEEEKKKDVTQLEAEINKEKEETEVPVAVANVVEVDVEQEIKNEPEEDQLREDIPILEQLQEEVQSSREEWWTESGRSEEQRLIDVEEKAEPVPPMIDQMQQERDALWKECGGSHEEPLREEEIPILESVSEDQRQAHQQWWDDGSKDQAKSKEEGIAAEAAEETEVNQESIHTFETTQQHQQHTVHGETEFLPEFLPVQSVDKDGAGLDLHENTDPAADSPSSGNGTSGSGSIPSENGEVSQSSDEASACLSPEVIEAVPSKEHEEPITSQA